MTLDEGSHTAELRTIDDGVFRDVDYVGFLGSKLWEGRRPLIMNMVGDAHPAWVYDPPDAWMSSPYHSGIATCPGHASAVKDASAIVHALTKLSLGNASLQPGDSIAIYGPSGPTYTVSYEVQVNNRTSGTFNQSKQFFRARQLLYYGANLGPGTHSVRLTMQSSGTLITRPQVLCIDYAEVLGAPSLGSSYSALEGISISQTPISSNLAHLYVSIGLLSVLSVLYLALLC
ncbi:hypothetical protein FA15DRAFT_758367 [Coprinopsis marcescibilis]|uniref:Uncharacterized protein n=1 Tax=Coprinopsis marcescibilis TaxID=230819 RepID=A0A5C3KN69_COPMA|nr:hypothetical protein FA15DRAFT_758367 [Coprinopsis marcescibilis]